MALEGVLGPGGPVALEVRGLHLHAGGRLRGVGVLALVLGAGVRRGRLTTHQHVQRGDELVPAVNGRQVQAGAGLVASHPRGARRRLEHGRGLLEGAPQFRVEVRLDVESPPVAEPVSQRGAHLLPRPDVGAEVVPVEGLPHRLHVGIIALTVTEQFGGDVVGARHLDVGQGACVQVVDVGGLVGAVVPLHALIEEEVTAFAATTGAERPQRLQEVVPGVPVRPLGGPAYPPGVACGVAHDGAPVIDGLGCLTQQGRQRRDGGQALAVRLGVADVEEEP